MLKDRNAFFQALVFKAFQGTVSFSLISEGLNSGYNFKIICHL